MSFFLKVIFLSLLSIHSFDKTSLYLYDSETLCSFPEETRSNFVAIPTPPIRKRSYRHQSRLCRSEHRRCERGFVRMREVLRDTISVRSGLRSYFVIQIYLFHNLTKLNLNNLLLDNTLYYNDL